MQIVIGIFILGFCRCWHLNSAWWKNHSHRNPFNILQWHSSIIFAHIEINIKVLEANSKLKWNVWGLHFEETCWCVLSLDVFIKGEKVITSNDITPKFRRSGLNAWKRETEYITISSSVYFDNLLKNFWSIT